MCLLLRGLAVALVFVVAMIPSPSCGQAVVYSWPLCLQGQYPYTMGTWPCYLYYVSYPFLNQVYVDPVDHVTQTEAELQSQENVTSVETEPENNTTDTAEQEITTSVETEPEDNTTFLLEVVAELQHQFEDQARQLDLVKNQLHILTVAMGKALQLLLERHGENERLEEKVEQQAFQMQNQINQMKQQRDRLHYLDHELHSLQETLNERRQVAFSVRFSRWTIVTLGAAGGGYAADTLKFNETITNIGDGYDPTTGLFTAPCAGLYAFFFSHHHSSGVYGRVTLGVFHGEKNIALGTAYGGRGVSCDRGSGFGTVHLTKGEVVNVRLMSTSSEEDERSLSYVEVGPFTTFSGMLVAPDRLGSLL